MSGFSLRGLIKRVVPRHLRVARFRVRSLLLLDQGSVEFSERERFFHHAFRALSFNGIDGDYVEFGCMGGTTFSLAYQQSRFHGHKPHLWAFDSFKGLPAPKGEMDEHPVWKEGHMATSVDQFHAICGSTGIPGEDYTVVPGFYEETLPRFSTGDAPTNICLAYIDCDLYSSTLSVFEFLMPRLKHGMIIALDDYYCWSATQIAGERRAMLDYFEEHDEWQLLPYMQYNWGSAAFVVESKQLLGAATKDRVKPSDPTVRGPTSS